MNEIAFTLRQDFTVPIEGSSLSPDVLSGKTAEEIQKLECWVGNRQGGLGDVFLVSGDTGSNPEDTKIKILGKTARLRRVGWRMTAGEIEVEQDVGFCLGERMSGGKILIKGNADGWAGTRMQGGEIEILGNAGHYLGGAYWGTSMGMQDGTITVRGNVGSEAGCWMSGGLIKIGGQAGGFAGIHMQKGCVAVYGSSGFRPGASMKGGTIVVLGEVPSVLPSFVIEGKRKSVKFGKERIEADLYLFTGDITEHGDGRLFISVEKNPHLSKYEAFTE